MSGDPMTRPPTAALILALVARIEQASAFASMTAATSAVPVTPELDRVAERFVAKWFRPGEATPRPSQSDMITDVAELLGGPPIGSVDSPWRKAAARIVEPWFRDGSLTPHASQSAMAADVAEALAGVPGIVTPPRTLVPTEGLDPAFDPDGSAAAALARNRSTMAAIDQTLARVVAPWFGPGRSPAQMSLRDMVTDLLPAFLAAQRTAPPHHAPTVGHDLLADVTLALTWFAELLAKVEVDDAETALASLWTRNPEASGPPSLETRRRLGAAITRLDAAERDAHAVVDRRAALVRAREADAVQAAQTAAAVAQDERERARVERQTAAAQVEKDRQDRKAQRRAMLRPKPKLR